MQVKTDTGKIYKSRGKNSRIYYTEENAYFYHKDKRFYFSDYEGANTITGYTEDNEKVKICRGYNLPNISINYGVNDSVTFWVED